MEVDLLDFVEQCRRLVKQALGKHAGEPASGGFARWKHVVLHCFRLEDGHSYRETPNRLKYMPEIRDALDLDQDDLPDHTTIYKSFDRLKCGYGGRYCAFPRSSTRSLAALRSTARSLTSDVLRHTSASEQGGRYRRSK